MPLPPGANIADAAALADELARFRIVDVNRLAGLLTEFTGGRAADLADFLVRRGALTPFQAERAQAGEVRSLVLGPYRLTGGPERGTFGPMFTATHASKPGPFSVCVLPLRSLWGARQAKQLARTLSAALTHPTVAPLVDVDSANGLHYLVWAAAASERLSDRVRASGPLPAGEAAALLGHLANALAACHGSGVVHGALTPAPLRSPRTGCPGCSNSGPAPSWLKPSRTTRRCSTRYRRRPHRRTCWRTPHRSWPPNRPRRHRPPTSTPWARWGTSRSPVCHRTRTRRWPTGSARSGPGRRRRPRSSARTSPPNWPPCSNG
ncbi:protein kinase family protein [Frigoriglobus tundricola]|uniref:Protein kinase domain-containing protein n=1 Tax=Frigoriglobus tundricola TaxID=2774151 RepID=A0A6M5YSZ3_9BACT|nr:hypothetical protein [Frigoriglobus tundricola]QJW97118.1 hypothetical protein FTUN_4683 [Frigoriglobus tundricola]